MFNGIAVDEIANKMRIAEAAQSHADALREELSRALTAAMAALLPVGTVIDLRDRKGPTWAANAKTLRGNDRGTRVFRVAGAPRAEIDLGNPTLSTWRCEAVPISESTGKDMSGRAHGADANRETVLLKGRVCADSYSELRGSDYVALTLRQFLDVLRTAEAASAAAAPAPREEPADAPGAPGAGVGSPAHARPRGG